jgi:hypothetical protein
LVFAFILDFSAVVKLLQVQETFQKLSEGLDEPDEELHILNIGFVRRLYFIHRSKLIASLGRVSA